MFHHLQYSNGNLFSFKFCPNGDSNDEVVAYIYAKNDKNEFSVVKGFCIGRRWSPENQIFNSFSIFKDIYCFTSDTKNVILIIDDKLHNERIENTVKSQGMITAGMLSKPVICGVDSSGDVLISNEGMPLQIMSPKGKFTLTAISCDERIKFVKLCGKSLYILTETHLRVLENFIE